MKSLYMLSIAAMLFIVSSCKVVQIMHTKPTTPGIRTENDVYVYENDSLQIIYLLWGANGHMTFTIKNKLDIPLYIDWKKSSAVLETKVKPYYSETEQSSFTSTSVGRRGRYNNAAVAVTSSNGVSVKAERITFIPPKSHIERTFGKLTEYDYIRFKKDEAKKVKLNGRDATQVELKNPQMPFRNFITYSNSEDFKTEQYVNNAFAVNKVSVMKSYEFGSYNSSTGKYTYYLSDQTAFHSQRISEYEFYKNQESNEK